ncbi:MAG: hypothetical protein HY303_09920 [Candidatus Wallbacteria bacterium]|nr:hypothetical protein [Candidatus Wallbacteria bacterium]
MPPAPPTIPSVSSQCAISLPAFLADVEVLRGPVSCALEVPTARGILWEASPGELTLAVPDVARYAVSQGRRVTYDPAPGATTKEIDWMFRLLPLAALLYQRGLLPLHAAGAADDSGAVLLAGGSASGKSTLMAELVRRGFKCLGDDVAPVELDAQGRPIVLPTYSQVLLWEDADRKLAVESRPSGMAVGPQRLVDLCDRFEERARPLKAIFRLTSQDGIAEADSPSTGADLFRRVTRLLYNSQVCETLADRARHLNLAAAVASRVPFHSLPRRGTTWNVPAIADRVLDALGGRGCRG